MNIFNPPKGLIRPAAPSTFSIYDGEGTDDIAPSPTALEREGPVAQAMGG